jgi:hypothetical protein
LRLQADYDIAVAKTGLAKTLAKIKRWTGAVKQSEDAR